MLKQIAIFKFVSSKNACIYVSYLLQIIMKKITFHTSFSDFSICNIIQGTQSSVSPERGKQITQPTVDE
jgi:hypothetical protein